MSNFKQKKMKKAVLFLMAIMFNISLISCTAEDLPEVQADVEIFAAENEGEGNQDPPEEEPED